jgi:LysR family transcriptional regulator, transcriptional activator of nhaA
MNFKHLYYFWVTARAGGIMRAGEQLHTTPQTLSGQIKLLEESLGRKLFRKSGRQLELTEDGRKALSYADDIFALGSELQAAMANTWSFGWAWLIRWPSQWPTGCLSPRCRLLNRCA